jgi:hypothetical protein
LKGCRESHAELKVLENTPHKRHGPRARPADRASWGSIPRHHLSTLSLRVHFPSWPGHSPQQFDLVFQASRVLLVACAALVVLFWWLHFQCSPERADTGDCEETGTVQSCIAVVHRIDCFIASQPDVILGPSPPTSHLSCCMFLLPDAFLGPSEA